MLEGPGQPGGRLGFSESPELDGEAVPAALGYFRPEFPIHTIQKFNAFWNQLSEMQCRLSATDLLRTEMAHHWAVTFVVEEGRYSK
jgi:hypothetical protein